jgi:sphingomyelin phosphodiesterase acid-like 3
MAISVSRTNFGVASWLLAALALPAQTPAKTTATDPTIPVLMLSDLHLDPFRDPAKVPKLAAAPISEWTAILDQPDSPADTQKSTDSAQALQGCGKAADSSYALLASSLKAEKVHAAEARFITISGDLLVHQFDCRYNAIMKSGGKIGYADFAEKTSSFVIERVEAAFPGVPVYVALGNNDSSCGDYKMDVNDRFFAGTSRAVMAGLRGADVAELKQARADYEAGGYFSVTLPGLTHKTRLLAIDDIFLSRKHTTCADKPDDAGADRTIAWLKDQLHSASENGERVWVMGHIPPGIDVYATLRKGDVCSGTKAETFLSSSTGSLGDVIANNSSTIRLAIFGHTHMDEMKLLASGSGGKVPVKGVASISPVDGNLPSFTVAQIDPATAELSDYTVFTASNKTGIATTWNSEYSFREAYHKPNFSAATLSDLASGFDADIPANAAASEAYEQYFDPGSPISPLVIAWHEYACGIDHYTEAGFKACTCATAK